MPALAAKYTAERILWKHHWTDRLISFRLSRDPAFRFTPGQFARLGLQISETGFVWRAYSIVSASWDDYLEFYSIVVPEGEFTPRLARLEVGDQILVDKTPNGFFTTDRFPDGEDLWLLATGTALGPYLSILHETAVWQRFRHIVLVHSVREAAELSYQAEIAALRQHPLWAEHGHKLHYLPVVTRETLPGTLSQRIPAMLADGTLERAAGVMLSPERSRLMICGSPQMVEDTHRQLKGMGYALSRLSAPAQLALENGW
ncbi:ferredoxin-NADP+ reductase [Pseudogulbenkiania sp. NH8B]|uniref:ferredoxin--NADP reductase n=1 Tax=Pseudogulbenkiania sp. (strain NH8B) TaxID=748280 RepID=UPI000227A60E|nr:ferredoxin--NADP reductase [Pseudogulbenkiania sp. NH8B]BAK78319.1 ferredoxin-NADP+ reductase [Pseudogulbenkiania sp. NH8B]